MSHVYKPDHISQIAMDTLTSRNFEVGKSNPCLCKHASKDFRLFYQGDDVVILANESDLQWFAKELNEALIVKVQVGGSSERKHSV